MQPWGVFLGFQTYYHYGWFLMEEQMARPLEDTDGGNDCRVAGLCRELCGASAPGSFTAAGLGDENPIFG